MRLVLCPLLIGREAERRALVDALDRGGLHVVVGEAGVGKSRLVRDVAGTSGRTVRTGRAVAGGVPAPYRPLAEAAPGGLRRPGDGAAARQPRAVVPRSAGGRRLRGVRTRPLRAGIMRCHERLAADRQPHLRRAGPAG